MSIITNQKEEVRGLGYINVVSGSTTFAKVPYSLKGFELEGDLNEEEAQNIADLIGRVIQNRNVSYKSGDKIRLIHTGQTNIIDIVVGNGVIARNERFYSFEAIEKI